MGGLLRRFWRSRRAAAAIEFAIIAPVMIFLAAGVTEFGRYIVVYDAANRLATQYAGAWSDCVDSPVGTCASELGTFASSSVVANIVPQLTASQTTVQMFQVTMSGTSPVIVSSYPAGASLTSAQTTAAQAVFTNGQSGVIVTVSYNHTLAYFSSLMGPYLNSLLQISFTAVQLKY